MSRSLVPAIGAALAAYALGAAPAGANVISPEPAHSPGAEKMTTLYWIGLIAAVIVIVAINAALIYTIRRYRSERGAEPRQIRSGAGIQRRVGAGLTVFALALFILGIVYTEKAREIPSTGPDGLELAKSGSNPTGANPLIITATGQQWLWRYDYPNNAFSYYRVVVPVDTTIQLRVLSTDVIHSWYVPELGGKVDAVPGKLHTTYFRADAEGTYFGDSAQFSGQGYAAMRTQVDVVSPAQYRSFISQQRRGIQAAQDAVTKQIADGDVPGSNPSTGSAAATGTSANGAGSGTSPNGATPKKAPNPAGAQVFASNGCGACHILAAANSTGVTGPNLDKQLAPDDNAAAIKTMIVDPNSEVVPGYPPNVMPQTYGQTLSSAQLNDLIQYLIETTPAGG